MWSLNIVSGLILPVMDITLLFNVRLIYRVNIWYIVILSISVIPMNFLFDFCIMYMLSISSDKIFIDWINGVDSDNNQYNIVFNIILIFFL